MVSAGALDCPACGTPISIGDRFCEGCGHELAPTAAGAGAAPSPSTFEPGAPAPCASCGSTAVVDGYCDVCGVKAADPRDHEEAVAAGVAGVSDKGRRHHRNEDAMAFAPEPGVVYAVVCDGVSTTVDPHVASLAAARAALDALVAGGSDAPAMDAAYDAARDAAVGTPFEPAPDLGPPSCTYLAAVVTDRLVTFASLGDCRAYWLGDAGATQLTSDDSWAIEQIECGAMSVEAAYADPKGHMITRWLGIDADPEWRPRITRFDPPGAGRVVLCSDGLWNYTLEPAQLVAAAGGEPDLLTMARRLVDFANDAGGADNITVVVVDVPLPKGDR
ncbi:MAG TPA: protein phosphatase 2C domain-containing protein [Acidimicrobiales bacterium]|jgi:serine/threonine protein phosphatase PrpC|nr:protein phosphatase 2C domain-containing protein [Acidimicrobiales bacterium]